MSDECRKAFEEWWQLSTSSDEIQFAQKYSDDKETNKRPMAVAFYASWGVPRWISVKDRLPEYGQTCLIYCPNDKYRPVDSFALLSKFPEGTTHWQPLPPPPKGDE